MGERASSGGSAKAKRKVAMAAITTLDRCTKLATSGLRTKAIEEIEPSGMGGSGSVDEK